MKKILFSYIMTDLPIDLWSFISQIGWKWYSALEKRSCVKSLLGLQISLSTKCRRGEREREGGQVREDAFVKNHSKGGQFHVLEWNVRVRSFLRSFRFYVSLCSHLYWDTRQETRAPGYSVKERSLYCSLVYFKPGCLSQHLLFRQVSFF